MTVLQPVESNLSKRLLSILTPEQARLLRSVAEEAAHGGLPLYIVGGFVRDLILDHPVQDFDLVVEGEAMGLAQGVAAKFGGRVICHNRFKSAQWFPLGSASTPEFVDFITARSETYKHPAALPTVKPGKLNDDLQRRDFTINTLAIRLDGKHFGELHDELGGLEDLNAGLIRVIHPASFTNDPTRLFRLVRYEQRYGFQIVPGTLALVGKSRSQLKRLSAERVRHELDLILDEENAAPMLKRLAELRILESVHPALKWTQASQGRFTNGSAAAKKLKHPPNSRSLGWALWLMDNPFPVLESIDKRLHFDSALRKHLLAVSAILAQINALVNKKPSRWVAFLDEFPLKAVQAAWLALPSGQAREGLYAYLETWRQIKPRTSGHDLKERGQQPGPGYQSILRGLRDAWLDGKVKTNAEEMALLEKLIKKK